jgi:hypothetical protein
MRGVVVVDRRRAVEVDFLHRPVERTVGVAQRQRAQVAGDEDRNASVILVDPGRVLVEVDRRAEGGAVVGRAGHREGDVDILNELGGVRVSRTRTGLKAARYRLGYPFVPNRSARCRRMLRQQLPQGQS